MAWNCGQKKSQELGIAWVVIRSISWGSPTVLSIWEISVVILKVTVKKRSLWMREMSSKRFWIFNKEAKPWRKAIRVTVNLTSWFKQINIVLYLRADVGLLPSATRTTIKLQIPIVSIFVHAIFGYDQPNPFWRPCRLLKGQPCLENSTARPQLKSIGLCGTDMSESDEIRASFTQSQTFRLWRRRKDWYFLSTFRRDELKG